MGEIRQERCAFDENEKPDRKAFDMGKSLSTKRLATVIFVEEVRRKELVSEKFDLVRFAVVYRDCCDSEARTLSLGSRQGNFDADHQLRLKEQGVLSDALLSTG